MRLETTLALGKKTFQKYKELVKENTGKDLSLGVHLCDSDKVAANFMVLFLKNGFLQICTRNESIPKGFKIQPKGVLS